MGEPCSGVPNTVRAAAKIAGHAPTPQQRRAARHQLGSGATGGPARAIRGHKKPITVDAIIGTAFGIVEKEGYEALTMRRVATALETGPSSLYAHVVNKEDLDELLIGRLCAGIDLPEPDPAAWRQQLSGVCAQLRDQYLRYPGISRAAFAAAPSNLDTLRVSEGMLAILLAGGIGPQAAAWAIDSLTLYVNAYSLEVSLVTGGPAAATTAGSSAGTNCCAGSPPCPTPSRTPSATPPNSPPDRPRPLRLHHRPDDRRPRGTMSLLAEPG